MKVGDLIPGRHYQLLRAAVVVPTPRVPKWHPQHLGQGAVVKVRGVMAAPSGAQELLVSWRDVVGRETDGWLSPRTLLRPAAPGTMYRAFHNEDDAVSMEDTLRHAAGMKGVSIPEWLETPAGRTTKTLALLEEVVRELGGRTKSSDDYITVARRVCRLLNIQEPHMARKNSAPEETEVVEAAPRSSKAKAKARANGRAAKAAEAEAPTKKARKAEAQVEAAETTRSSAVESCGNLVAPLLKKAGADASVQKLAQRMAQGTPLSKKQYLQLRDGVNAAAAQAREDDNGSLASELSAANRLVRRLSRLAE